MANPVHVPVHTSSTKVSLPFPCFSGTSIEGNDSEFKTHLLKLKTYFLFSEITDDQKKLLLLFHSLKDKASASAAYLEGKLASPGYTYVEYENDLKSLFLPTTSLNVFLQKFRALQQGPTEDPISYTSKHYQLYLRSVEGQNSSLSIFIDANLRSLINPKVKYRLLGRVFGDFAAYLKAMQEAVAVELEAVRLNLHQESQGLGVDVPQHDYVDKDAMEVSQMDIKCHYCHKTGHRAIDCFARKRKEAQPATTNTQSSKPTTPKSLQPKAKSADQVKEKEKKFCKICKKRTHNTKDCYKGKKNISSLEEDVAAEEFEAENFWGF
ncbi:MAG: hypothetical protein GY738_10475 [Pseudoalteromonas sp.]|nr:hypothetical protein [Pseudoalteromonas sp.]